jgi:hypothetical protein
VVAVVLTGCSGASSPAPPAPIPTTTTSPSTTEKPFAHGINGPVTPGLTGPLGGGSATSG